MGWLNINKQSIMFKNFSPGEENTAGRNEEYTENAATDQRPPGFLAVRQAGTVVHGINIKIDSHHVVVSKHYLLLWIPIILWLWFRNNCK